MHDMAYADKAVTVSVTAGLFDFVCIRSQTDFVEVVRNFYKFVGPMFPGKQFVCVWLQAAIARHAEHCWRHNDAASETSPKSENCRNLQHLCSTVIKLGQSLVAA